MKPCTKFFCVLFFLLLCRLVPGQQISPYAFHWKKDVLLLTGGLGSMGLGVFLLDEMDPPNPEKLDRASVLFMDRFAVDLNDEVTETISDIGMFGGAGFPIFTGLILGKARYFHEDLLMYFESFCWMQGLVFITKASFHRPRPYAYREAEAGKTHFSTHAAQSFISGHTAASFNGAVFAAVVFQQRHPDSPWVIPVWIAGLATATTTAITRVTSGRHFPTDVLAGAAVGSLTGWLIPRLHRKANPLKKISLVTGSKTGIQIRF